MAVAVQGDAVPRVDDLAGERRVAQDLLADEEEGRANTLAREDLEHRRRALCVRAVVEGQRIPSATGGAVLDPQRPAQSRPRTGEAREQVARGGARSRARPRCVRS